VSASNTPEVEAPAVKRRSPVERAVVWGGILILLAVVAVEFTGFTAQRQALDKLTEAMESGLNSGKTLHAAEVRSIVGREPVREADVVDLNLYSNAKRMEVYRWLSLIPMKPRELFVYYGTGGIGGKADEDVISVTTSEDTNAYQHGSDEQPTMYPSESAPLEKGKGEENSAEQKQS